MVPIRIPCLLLGTMLMLTAGCLTNQGTDPVASNGAEERHPLQDLVLPSGTPLEQAFAALTAADRAQLGPVDPNPGAAAEDPAEAVRQLAARSGHTPTIEEELRLLDLVHLPPATAHALGAAIAAFTELSEAADTAYAHGAPAEITPLVAAQHRFVQTVVELDHTIQAHGTASLSNEPMTIGAVIAIDLSNEDTEYRQNYLLIIDLGGEDHYTNNAGGNAMSSIHCRTDDTTVPIPRPPTAAAVIDLAGHDRYEPERSCGVNGGGTYGLGMIIDSEGNDTYTAGSLGTNGGGYAHGVGLLLDAKGNDNYTGRHRATNGGGFAGGYGRLVDLRGHDSYSALAHGVNGGARGGHHCISRCENVPTATGLLLDLGGSDHYYDLDSGETEDRIAVPKGLSGAQIDLPLFA